MSSGGDAQAVTLKEVSVAGSVIHSLADVSVSHTYVNNGDTVDVTYKLPLSEEELGIVHGFEVVVDGKVIECVVRETGEACKVFEQRSSRSFGDYLKYKTIRDKPYMLFCTVEQFEPQQVAVIKIRYLYELPSEDRIVRFILPTTTFQNAKSSSALSLNLNINMQSAIESIESAREIQVEKDEAKNNTATVKFVSQTTTSSILQEDFQMVITTSAPEVPVQVEKDSSSSKYAARLRFLPNFVLGETNSEFVFLLDNCLSKEAGSVATLVLNQFLTSLQGTNQTFNIVTFGSSDAALSPLPSAIESTNENIEKAQKFLADLEFVGHSQGSSVCSSLSSVFSMTPAKNRQVVIVSSGRITDVMPAVEIIKKGSPNTRVFSVGVGSDTTHYMLNALAKAGSGKAVFIYKESEVEEGVKKQLKKLRQPSFEKISISCQIFPETLEFERNLFTNDPFTLFTSLTQLPEKPVSAHLAAIDCKGTTHFAALEINPESASEVSSGIIHQLAAKARINQLSTKKEESAVQEMIELGKTYALLSSHTGFVAPEESPKIELLCADVSSMFTYQEENNNKEESDEEEGSEENSAEDVEDEDSEEESDSPKKEAKKTFARDFLLQFQSMCRDKPEGIAEGLDYIYSNHNPPTKGKGGRSDRGDRQGGDRQGGGGGRGRRGGGQKKTPRGEQAPAAPVVELTNRAENRWQRPTKSAADDEGRQAVILLKARGILNKLTLSTFSSLFEQLRNVGIDTPEILEGVIALIFDKALGEPKFSSMYADLCVELAKSLPTFDKGEEKLNFRRVLLKNCQEEFERSEVEIDPTLGELERQELKDKAKRRGLGNIKFIGELFKRKMLTENIMIMCIRQLLKTPEGATLPEEDNIEALCKLLTTIGKLLDAKKREVDPYYEFLNLLTQNKEFGSRHRFMIQDVLDLRAMNWVPRRAEEEAKTISEVHKDAKLEDIKKDKESRAVLSNMRKSSDAVGAAERGRGGRGGDYGRSGRGNDLRASTPSLPATTQPPPPAAAASGGWEVAGGKVGKRGGAGGRGGRDEGRNAPEESGRGGRGGKKDWRSSSEGAVLRPQEQKGSGGDKKNLFSALNDGGSGGGGRGGKGRGGRGGSGPGRDSRDSRDSRDQPSQNRRDAPSGGKGQQQQQPQRGQPKAEPESLTVSRSDIQVDSGRQIELLLEEYLSSYDTAEAMDCLQELSPSQYSEFVKEAVLQTLEKKPKDRELIGKLFDEIAKAKLITTDQFTDGFNLLLELLEDLEVDIPFASKYSALFVGKAIVNSYLPLSYLKGSSIKQLSPGLVTKIVLEALNVIREGWGADKTAQSIKDSKLDILELTGKPKEDLVQAASKQYNGLVEVFETL